jgi:hypothetical protein
MQGGAARQSVGILCQAPVSIQSRPAGHPCATKINAHNTLFMKIGYDLTKSPPVSPLPHLSSTLIYLEFVHHDSICVLQ